MVDCLARRIGLPTLIGFSLFNWLLSQVSVHVANTGAYAQPVVALALGWVLLAEQVTPRMFIGIAAILIAVALIVWCASRTRQAEAPVEFDELAA